MFFRIKPSGERRYLQIVGLYMMPPDNVVVLLVDEKPSIQALERGQGYLTRVGQFTALQH